MLKELLKPDLWVEDITKIKLEDLEDLQVKGIICDLDNTLVSWGDDYINPKIKRWLLKLKQEGYKICLVSNTFSSRIDDIASLLDLSFISRALKPVKWSYLKAADRLSLSLEEIVVIGDQLFTDVLGGNRSGMNTILVDPLGSRELLFTRLIRRVEDRIKRRLLDEKL